MINNPAPLSLEEVLSPAWLGQALNLPVRSVEVVETIKTVATKVRFRVDLATDADAVRAYCAKGVFGSGPLAPGYARITQTEANFYRELAATVGVNTARPRYTAIDGRTGHGLSVMDDVVAAGGRFLTPLEPYSPKEAMASLEQLAVMHALHWGGAGLDGHAWLRNRLADLAESPLRTVAELQELLDDPRGDALPAAIKDAGRVTRALQALARHTDGQIDTLVHGDAHAGNLFVLDGATSLVDWQLLQRTNWGLDVAYHLGAVLSVEDRRESERDLLDYYLQRLAALGVMAPSRQEAWDVYRAGVAYGYYLWAVTRRVDPPVIHEFCKRLGTAVADLESFELLGV
ncbi:phosphotransferase [Nonomuraea sp. NPDC005650]|uniref:phosphotransferase family protein n=1 Tax=Nonomuraea sp. NPDC005650 TaxID=3157045 RepID=UPI0033A49272